MEGEKEKREQIQERVREVLPRVELEQSTFKTIQALLESELGFPLGEYKDLLKSEVDLFLREQAMRESPLLRKRKAAEDAVVAQLHDAAKKKKQESKVPGFYQLSTKRYVGLKTFQGKHLVDIREFYEKDGQMLPGRTGISLTLKQWECLRSKVLDGEVDALVSAEPCSSNMVNMSFEISPTKKISLVLLGDSIGYDIREFYDSNGEMKPSKKGICLPRAQYDGLKIVMGPLQEEIARLDSGDAGGNEAGDKAPVVQQQQPPQKYDDGAPSAPPPPSEDAGPTKHALSQNRYVSLENWRGSDLLNLREYYEKDGELRPGKKGISLTSPQARTILEKMEEISQAFAQRDESFSLEISPKRKVTISIFKGMPMVNVREYYEKNGEMCPGAKGLSMPEEQWTAFKAVLPNLVKTMK